MQTFRFAVSNITIISYAEKKNCENYFSFWISVKKKQPASLQVFELNFVSKNVMLCIKRNYHMRCTISSDYFIKFSEN